MSAALFHLGLRRPPKNVRRRVAWLVVTLVPLAALAGLFIFGAVRDWIAITQDQLFAPGVGEALVQSLVGFGFLMLFVITLVGGSLGVREGLAEERKCEAEQRLSANAGSG